MKCNLCPRNCNTLRTDNDNISGVCGMPKKLKIARADLHFWEEPCISGENGSGTVFFSGCPLNCVYCQNYDISHKKQGKEITAKDLAEIFYELEQKGAHNINLVTPTHYVLGIKEALSIYKPKIPIVYNSSGYEKVKILKSLEGLVDIYLLDFKYISNEKAEKYSAVFDYPEVVKKAILEVYRQQEKCIFENGIMQKGVIVRHLLLPQSTRDAISIFDWVKDNTPNAYFSIMSQYTPNDNLLEFSEINRKVTKREYQKVLDYIFSTDFSNVYIQEKSSASKDFIPDFNLK